jgi:hypothetical protein
MFDWATLIVDVFDKGGPLAVVKLEYRCVSWEGFGSGEKTPRLLDGKVFEGFVCQDDLIVGQSNFFHTGGADPNNFSSELVVDLEGAVYDFFVKVEPPRSICIISRCFLVEICLSAYEPPVSIVSK